MRDELIETITDYLATLEDEGISPHERLSVWVVLADVLTLAGIGPDDWPAALRATSDEAVLVLT